MAVEKIVTPPRCPKGALFLESESFSPQGRGTWYARVPHEHSIEDVLDPAYFGNAHQDKGVRTGDIIDIEPASALWRIQVRVMALQPDIQHVKVRETVALRQNYSADAPKGYRFEWDGTAGKWTLYRGTTLVDGGFDSQDEAAARAQELTRDNKPSAAAA